MAWKEVNKEELITFIKTYPYPLSHDFYMDWHSWNDFRDDRVWPESMVAMMQEIYDIETYRIRDDYIKT